MTSFKAWLRLTQYDILLSLILGLVVAFAVHQVSRHLMTSPSATNWFGLDVLEMSTSLAEANHAQPLTRQHPLFSLVSRVPVRALIKLFPGLGADFIVSVATAFIAGLWTVGVFVALRVYGSSKATATLFALLAVFSSSAVFGLSVPGPHVLESLSLLLALIVLGLAERYYLKPFWYSVAFGLTASMRFTSGLVGALASCWKYPWKQAAQIVINGFCAVLILWGVQKLISPSSDFFLGTGITQSTPGFRAPNLSFVLGSPITCMVMPAVDGSTNSFAYSLPGAIAVFSWVGMISLGVWSLLRLHEQKGWRLLLIVTVVWLTTQTLFVEVPFLYLINLVPPLLLICSSAIRTRARVVGLCFASLLLISTGINNTLQFRLINYRNSSFVIPTASRR